MAIAASVSRDEEYWYAVWLWISPFSARIDTSLDKSIFCSRYRYREYFVANLVCSVSKSLSFAYEGYMNDILQPFGSRCRFRNEWATNPRKATERHARMNDTSEHPRGRIRTRPSRKLGLFDERGNSEDVSSAADVESSSNGNCRIDVIG